MMPPKYELIITTLFVLSLQELLREFVVKLEKTPAGLCIIGRLFGKRTC